MKHPINCTRKFVYAKEEKKKASIKELRPYLRYYKKFNWKLFGIFWLFILSCFCAVMIPIYTGKGLALFTTDFDVKKIVYTVSLVLMFALANGILSMIINRIWSYITVNSTYYINQDLIKRLNIITQKSFDSADSGIFTARLYGDVSTIGSIPMEVMKYFFNFITELSFVAYTFSLNIWVGLFMLAFDFVSILVAFYRINTRQKHKRFIQKISEKQLSFRSETIRGMKDIRGINATDQVVEKNDELTKEKLEYEYSASLKIQKIFLVEKIYRATMDFVFIILCVYMLVIGQLEIAGFMIAYNYRGRLFNFANYAVTIKDYFSNCNLAAQRLNEILDESKYPVEKYGDIELANPVGQLQFKNVTFGYGKEDVLKNINLDIKPNTITALVGLSGAGKSTVVALVDRFYDIKDGNGEICIDGINIKKLTRNGLRDNVCAISQNPYIFNMTIADNLRLANSCITEEQMIDALKRANIYDYVQSLPQNINTKLGENGIKLSGGQKQRIAIARALCRKSKIILFDEATSALDNKNQQKIKDTIFELAKDHTVIVIAHRLSTIVDAQNIVLIHDGQVKAQGKHKELMKKCVEYYDLYNSEE